MRKLPSYDRIRQMLDAGISHIQIANMYRVNVSTVYNATAKMDGRFCSRAKPAKGRTFTAVGSQPTVHRDTGQGTGFGQIVEMDEVHELELYECSDWLKEWRVAV